MAPPHTPPDRPQRSAVNFTLSGPPSTASSRAGSPAPSTPSSYSMSLQEDYIGKTIQDDPGCRPMDVYDATLPPWRAAVRRKLVASIRVESVIVAKMQDAIRSPWLDAYFVHTSALGTHTFFMTFLPMLFFFGYDELGRGLIIVLCLGIYLTSVAKDLFCSPRPFAPPVTRLTIGTHHLEYGMPSTHSTNAVSLALFFFAHIHELAFPASPTDAPPALSLPAYAALTAGLAVYATSIVFGRLYTAMHSFSDCLVGVALGLLLWLAHTSFAGIPLTLFPASSYAYSFNVLRGWGWGAHLDGWILSTPSSLRVPLTLIPLALLAVNQHPQPVDDCPCFEDAIAIGSVMLGMLVARWGAVRWGVHALQGAGVVMPGSGWVRVLAAEGQGEGWVAVERGWGDVGVWWGAAVLKMVFGILIIFVWRLLAKAACHRALPPTFRFLATLMRLPHRRFYTPATEYASVPPVAALRPIPSVIDLPSSAGVEVGGIGSGRASASEKNGKRKESGLRRRVELGGLESGEVGGDVSMDKGGEGYGGEGEGGEGGEQGEGDEVKHYDADVLTKLIVYAGIAVIACEGMPVLFERFGWGVRSWP
ncbi:PAP2 superfamily-domain-containing protein [Mycena epipterygia]|nr:PAP2 superfamily-domain-containing protein [Mycena epipterygia]